MKGIFQRFLPQTVVSRVLWFMVVSMLLLVVVPSWFFYRAMFTRVAQEAEARGQSAYRQVLMSIEQRSEMMAMLTHTVAQTPQIQKAFAAGDREALAEATVELYKELAVNYDVNILQLHIPPAISFFRAHQPDKFGDDLSSFRQTVVEANARKIKVQGLEMGVGGMSARAVVPLSHQGRHRGSVELGMAVNNELLKRIHAQTGSHISLVIPEGDGFKYLAKSHNLSIQPKQFPFLRQMMQVEKPVSKRVEKDGTILVTTYGPIKDFSGRTVGVLAVPIDVSAELRGTRRTVIVIIGIAIGTLTLFIGFMYWIFSRLVQRPVVALKAAMEEASCGNLTWGFDHGRSTGRNGSGQADANEFTALTMYFGVMIENMRQMVGAIQRNSDALNDAAGSLDGMSRNLVDGAGQAAGRAGTVAAASEEMSTTMNAVAAAVEEAAANLHIMSTSTEGMNVTIGEIQQQAATARGVTSEAVNTAQEINMRVDELGNAAREIGQVTETITEISSQTNLLALNATIEAARAGEAGKGFAVVAGEIKELARQTANATGEIKQRIEGIQNASGLAVTGIRQISGVIAKIDEIVASIVAAIDEQANTMRELTGNIQQAGAGVGEVARNVGQTTTVSLDIAKEVSGLHEATADISHAGGSVQDNASQLRQLAEELKTLVSSFRLQ